MDDEDDFVNELLDVAMNPEYQTADVLPVLLDEEDFLTTK